MKESTDRIILIKKTDTIEIMIEEEKLCRMCGMELHPYIKTYKRSDNGRTYVQIIKPKAFCDSTCYGHYLKRLWSDEYGTTLQE